MRTVLLTGAAGFVGSNFAIHWRSKHPEDRILVLDALTYAGNPDNLPHDMRSDTRLFEFWHGTVCNDDLVNTLVSRSDVVVHFAAESHVARSIYDNKVFFKTDVMGTQTVANAVVKSADTVERFIHISTSEVYGTAESDPMTEDHPLNPTTPYAASKAGADRLVYSYVATYGLPAVIIRPFNQYGPRQHLEKVVPRFITSALNGEPLTVHGSGLADRDWMHVADTCELIGRVIDAPLETVRGEAINIGSGECLDVMTIAKMVLAQVGGSDDLIQHVEQRRGQVDHHISSLDKRRALLGAQPARRFEDGLHETIKWYDENRQWWKRLEWMKLVPTHAVDGKLIFH